jgi:transcriptional regulator with GAF, ATPase, and Fis domain
MYISNYDNINDEVSIFFQTKDYEMIESLPESRKRGNGLSEYVIKTKEGLLLNGRGWSSFHKKNNLKTYGTKAKSWVGVPLISENKVVGVLTAQYFKEAIVYNE